MRHDSSDTATFAAVGVAAAAVACCAGLPALAAVLGGLSLAAILDAGAGLLALAGLAGASALIVRARRAPRCPPGAGPEA